MSPRRALGIWMLLAACGQEPPAGPESTSSSTVSSSTVTTTTTATSPPSTSTSAPANRPPTVRVEGGGACHPSAAGSRLGARPCSVPLRAEASDPDGDTLSFAWSGCASGDRVDALCAVPAPGTFTATLTVRDGRGGVAQASALSQGTNQAPVVRFGFSGRPPDPAPSNQLYSIAGGQPEDPDGDEDPNQICNTVTFSVSGPCTSGPPYCGGVGDVFDVDVHTTNGPGTCVLEATARDSWGAVGSDRLEFRVLPP